MRRSTPNAEATSKSKEPVAVLQGNRLHDDHPFSPQRLTSFGYISGNDEQPIQVPIDSNLTESSIQVRNIHMICLPPLVQMNVGFALMS
jgi:hypothetical protein